MRRKITIADLSRPPASACAGLPATSAATAPEPAPPSKNMLAKVRLKQTKAWMAARWPAAFNAPLRPLAIGVGSEIIADPSGSFTVQERRWALAAWCGRPDYLRALVEGRVRVNLDADGGAVTDDEREHALGRLKALKIKRGAGRGHPELQDKTTNPNPPDERSHNKGGSHADPT